MAYNNIRPLDLRTSETVIIVRVPHSWAQPHVVNHGKHWRFYSRNSAGKYPLDISEVRAAFALSETVVERIRLFRAERLCKITAGETPVAIEKNAKIILHIVPFGAFDPTAKFDVSSLGESDDVWTFKPLGKSLVTGHRYNLDGLLTYTVSRDPLISSYLQIFRNGIIETIDASTLRVYEGSSGAIPSVPFEERLLEALPIYLSIQERLGIAPPLFIMLSLLEVSGFVLEVNPRLSYRRDRVYPIDRDALVLPEVTIESFAVEPSEVMRPIFDSVWNATGWPRSMNYNESGEWRKDINYPS